MAYQKTMAYQKITLLKTNLVAIALAALLFSSNLFALGLGTMEVSSNLDQPLEGLIQLRVSDGDDINSIVAKIASREDFEKLGIAYPSYMKDISLSLDTIDGDNVIRVISNNVVIKEPFIHFLVRIDWSGGSFLREYTALIDPPTYAAETPKSLSQPRWVGSDQSYQAEDYPELEVEDIASSADENYETEALDEIFNDVDVDSETSYQDSYEEESFDSDDTVSAENADDSYSDIDSDYNNNTLPTDAQYGPVESGESLSLIAAELQRQFPDLSIYQIMQVLFEENRGAFIDENINGLLAGVVLNIGDLDAIRAVDVAQAKQFFFDQLTEWDPSSLLPASSSDDGLSVAQNQYSDEGADDLYDFDTSNTDFSDTSTDSFQVGASTESQSLITGSDGDNRAGEVLVLQQQIADLESSLSSSSLENIELSERISLLEGQLSDMNRLISLDVEDADLAGVEATLAEQNNANDLFVDDLLLDSDENTEMLNSSAVDLANSEDLINDFDSNSEADLLTDDEFVNVDDGTDVINNDSGIESVLDSVDDETTITDLSIDDSTASLATGTSTINSKSKKDDGFFSRILEDSKWLIMGGVGGLLLIGLGILIIRRRRADEEFEISMLSIETQSESINKASEAATISEVNEGSQDRETSFLTVYSDSDAVVQADEVDPIAEADVYIAYGRDEQAEEVLLDGIVRKPERVDIKQKLLGLYHKNSNIEGFERMAEELYSQKDHLTSSIWQQVSLMGKDIAPDNPLFEVSASEIFADELLKNDKIIASDNAIVTNDESNDESPETSESSEGDVPLVTPEEDASIHLINFDEGRSEMSELDQVEIDVLLEEELENTDQNISEDPDDEVDLGDTLDFERIDVLEEDSEKPISDANREVSDLEVDDDYDESRTQFELAKVFVDLGDEDGARKILSDIVTNDSIDKDVVEEAKTLLKSIDN